MVGTCPLPTPGYGPNRLWDLVTDTPATRWLIEDYYGPDPKANDRTYAKHGAFLRPVDFDPLAFGIPLNILPAADQTPAALAGRRRAGAR